MKQEEQKYCLNCGNPCHEGVVLTRKERTYPSEGSKEYEIEVCRPVSYTHLTLPTTVRV